MGDARWRGRSRHCAASREVAGAIVSLEFFVDLSFRPHYGPELDSASKGNEYQEYFLGIEAAGAYGRETYNIHVQIVWKSGNFILLETSGFVQALWGLIYLYFV